MARQFNTREMIDRWNAGDESALTTAREIVSEYQSAIRDAERAYQAANVASHAASVQWLIAHPRPDLSPGASRLREMEQDVDLQAQKAQVREAKAALDAIEQPLRDTYISAKVFIDQVDAANARVRSADQIDLAERIAYGER